MRPTQAAILCGGLGTRLRPLTTDMPKPMAPVNGRPFLTYLIEQLRDQGVRRIVLMTGYRGEMIREHFQDGSELGVEIAYSHGPTEWETGRRVWEAAPMLDHRFMLLYSDNFVPISVDAIVQSHDQSRATITLLLQPKQPGNIRLNADGGIAMYDSTRKAPGLDHVEIGYMIVERDATLARYGADRDVSFSRILAPLAADGKLGGVVTRDPYHSISDLPRLRLAERYLAPKRILLVDRDGTINRRPPKAEYVRTWADFTWIDESVDAMRRLARAGFRFVVISNQAGIARGMQIAAEVDAVNRSMVETLAREGVEVLGVYVCPHHWDEHCDCRKPKPGMFHDAARDHLIRLDRTIFVGDDPRDARAAHNALCVGVLVGPERDQDPGGGARPAFTSATMLEAVPWIVERFEQWEAADAPRAVEARHAP